MKMAAAARMVEYCILRLGWLEVASLVTCGIRFSVAFLWGLMLEREGWFNTAIYVARGSLARGALTFPHHHIDLSARSSLMTLSYFFGDYKDVEA